MSGPQRPPRHNSQRAKSRYDDGNSSTTGRKSTMNAGNSKFYTGSAKPGFVRDETARSSNGTYSKQRYQDEEGRTVTRHSVAASSPSDSNGRLPSNGVVSPAHSSNSPPDRSYHSEPLPPQKSFWDSDNPYSKVTETEQNKLTKEFLARSETSDLQLAADILAGN